jgi:hypothetical protein
MPVAGGATDAWFCLFLNVISRPLNVITGPSTSSPGLTR